MTRFQQFLLGGALVGFAVLVAGWASLDLMIRTGVEESVQTAQESFPQPGDDVAALVAYVQDPRHGLQARNRAVWALGRLRDPRALPVLEADYTGEPCDHGRFLCQRELDKAIKLCRGGTFSIPWILSRLGQP